MSLNPYQGMKLVGQWSVYGVTIALPREDVRWMLPDGLELGDQDLTHRDTHPVSLYFGHVRDAHMTFPRFFPPEMTYFEQVVGVPYVYAKRPLCGGRVRGPFFYMPRLFLTNLLATLGGILFWGFPKKLVRVVEGTNPARTDGSYAVCPLYGGGDEILGLQWGATGAFEPATAVPSFQRQLEIMTQPLVSQQPLSVGPLLSCSDFDKLWREAEIRPLRTKTNIQEAFVPGLAPGRYSSEGIDQSPTGAFQLRAPWELSLPYCCGRGRAPGAAPNVPSIW
ncbi:acetoacetate decarboxylase family protein [Polyangium jinanense]|uniref:Acetoacetate decarboxylase family protein n=1 Tax=Polyangium jinanense TaxID=2829994 RepID=A0A9X3X5U0_9BACT|nr:acetoacetate decarboxylase family protein [Polyangium jinanense]MDC3956111.1 acetoacetate decarboxylase family protein [Polyangium jinanense]MDC3982858.1 acetoacetate decarboxylase family protein [Polyangium jinanense]